MNKQEFIFGIHTVKHKLQQNPKDIVTIYFIRGKHHKRIHELMELAKKHHVQIEFVTLDTMQSMFPNANHQGVLAKCKESSAYSENDLEQMIQNLEKPFILILDCIEDPHNLGACMRSANAAGVDCVIAPKDKAAGLTSAARKVASGAAEVTPFIQVTNLARTLRLLRDNDIWIFGLADKAQKSIYEADFNLPIALVLGNESKGLRQLTIKHCDELLQIPMHGAVFSLNVSCAASVCMYEAVRQRIE